MPNDYICFWNTVREGEKPERLSVFVVLLEWVPGSFLWGAYVCFTPRSPSQLCGHTPLSPCPVPLLVTGHCHNDRGHFSISGGQWESYGSFGNKASLLALCAVIILKNVKGVGAWSLPPVATGSNLQSEQQHFCGFASPCWEPYLFLVHNIKSRGLVFLVQCFCMSAPECRFKFPQFITT